MQLFGKIFNKIGWSGIILILFFICVYAYSFIRKSNKTQDAAYTKGTSLGVNKGVRGSLYLYYSFRVNNQLFKGNVTNDFCKKCNACCDSGNSVIVRYQRDNPNNNDLVINIPGNTILEDEQ